MLSLAVDGAATWRRAPAGRQVTAEGTGAPTNAMAARQPALVAPALHRAAGR